MQEFIDGVVVGVEIVEKESFPSVDVNILSFENYSQFFLNGVVTSVAWQREPAKERKILVFRKKKPEFIEPSPIESENSSVKIPTKYLESYEVPRDVNKYIEELLPNMRIALFRAGKENKEWIIGEFVIYLLGTTKQGTPRYKIYDPIKHPNIPYYKWFLSQLKYFLMQDFRQKELERAKRPLEYREEFSKDEDMKAAYAPRYETESVFDKAYINLLPEYLQALEAQSKERGKDSFEAHAYELYQAKILGEKQQVFAARLGISAATASHWVSKLEKVVTDYFSGNYVDVINTI